MLLGSERPQLGHGTWLGREIASQAVRGFCLTEIEPEEWGDALPEHSHQNAHVVLPIQGRYLAAAVNAPEFCTSSTVIYNPPGVVHRDRFESSRGQFLGISISNKRFASLETSAFPSHAVAFREARVVSLAHVLRRETQSWDSNSPLIVEGMCLEILGRISRFLKHDSRCPPSWLGRVLDYINDSIALDITLADLANVAAVSESDLNRGFRRSMKCAPGSYLRSARMTLARSLLTTKMPLVEISSRVGFADQSAFNKAFKRWHGYAPGEFRRKS